MKFPIPKLFLLLAGSLLLACEDENPVSNPVVAEASAPMRDYDSGNPDKPQRGEATFSQTQDGVVTAIITVNDPDLGGRRMGVHIHAGGLENPGMHFNADLGMEKACGEQSLGTPWNRPYIGDVGNLETNDAGQGSLTVTTDLWNLDDSESPNNILNRSLIIHFGESNFAQECDPNHDPGHSHSNPKYLRGLITLD